MPHTQACYEMLPYALLSALRLNACSDDSATTRGNHRYSDKSGSRACASSACDSGSLRSRDERLSPAYVHTRRQPRQYAGSQLQWQVHRCAVRASAPLLGAAEGISEPECLGL